MKIEAFELTKKYGNNYALDNVSFILDKPIIYGLLGGNGAGKTTFMEILAGHILKTEGGMTVNGENPFDNRTVTKNICFIKESNNFKKELKIKQVLKIYELFYSNWDNELANELLNVYKLNSNTRIRSLSKGMESALGVIVGLASKAMITIFDEPYIGMDAAARKKFYEILLDEFEANNRTIIFSTHLIDEVSQLFEEVLILQDGKLLLHENTETLRDQIYAVSGKKADVETFIKNKRIIKTKELVGTMTAYIFDKKKTEIPLELNMEGVPMQELMIYLTDSREEVQ